MPFWLVNLAMLRQLPADTETTSPIALAARNGYNASSPLGEVYPNEHSEPSRGGELRG